jgi:hypothetical protein
VNVNAYIPADYVPYEQAKIEVHRRVASALEVAEVERLREELPEALYEAGRSQVSVRVPSEGAQRFPTVVRAADVLLSVVREAA